MHEPRGLRPTALATRDLTTRAPGRRQKMEQREYIILCLEDINDWTNATTRRLVMQASAWDGHYTFPSTVLICHV
jgi:hypothetical protein